MKRVIIESPLHGDFVRNLKYARLCCLDSLQREAPYASHLIYTQMLDDRIREQRRMGMEAGFCWAEVADLRAFYIDLGISNGMSEAIELAHKANQPSELRTLPVNLFARLDDTEEVTPGAIK